MTNRRKILIVDDKPTNLAILEEILEDDYDLQQATDGEECLEVAQRFRPDVVLLDVMMPVMDGYEACRRMRQIPELEHVKVIMLSAKAMAKERLQGYEAGADDYLAKPFDDEEVLAKIRVFLRLRSVEQGSVADREVIEDLARANDRLAEEVRLREQAEARLRYDSLHDPLTQLPNRALLLDRLERCQRRKQREPNYCYAVLFLDLDDFKIVNDSLGHEAGDGLLIEVGRRLQRALREVDTVARSDRRTTARLGGDEFVLLLEDVGDAEGAWIVESRVRSVLEQPVEVEGQPVRAGGSIGIAFGRSDYATGGEVLRDADIAMYHAKGLGKDQSAIFDDAMRDRVVSRQRFESDLLHAIGNGELQLHYQPILDLGTGELHGFEALVRWIHPERGSMSPAEFIPMAEETGLIVPLGRWVLRTACAQTALWRERFPEHESLSISINVSGRQFLASPMLDTVQEVLAEVGLEPRYVNLELTETVMIDSRGGDASMEAFRELGMGLHMDDFGTGYSSLSYLSRLPISVLKLDGSFVGDMLGSEAGEITVRALLEIAHSRGLSVVAEGVETQEQCDALRSFGCDLVQGYFFSRPLKVEAADEYLENWGRGSAVA